VSSLGNKEAPPVKAGRIWQKTPIRPIGQATQKSHLKTRMKADDSKAVNMSDTSLGKGISSE
jgi:hypothetical protein